MNVTSRVLATVAAAAVCSASHATILVNYEFNEPIGTGLASVANFGSGTIAPWANDPDATTDGAGALEVTGPLGFQARGLTGGSAINGGTAYLRIDFESWGPASPGNFFVFGMRLASPNPPPANESWRLQLSSGDASDSNSAGQLVEVGGHSLDGNMNNVFAGSLPTDSATSAAMPNGLSVIMGINLDNDTTSVWWDPNRTGTYTIVGGRQDVAINSTAGSTDFTVINGLQLNGSGGPYLIDRYVLGTDFDEVAAIPEPGAAAVLAGLSLAWSFVTRRWG